MSESEIGHEEETERSVTLVKGATPVDVSSLGTFTPEVDGEGGIFMLKKGDHSKIFTHFKTFYVHRVQFIGLDESQKDSLFDSYDPLSDIQPKPTIREKTNKYAKKKRSKQLSKLSEEQLQDVRAVGIFLIPALDQGKVERKRKELEERELQECHFKPVTLNYKGEAAYGNGVTHGDRCKDLYAKKVQGWFAEKTERTAEDYEYERSKEDLTFHP